MNERAARELRPALLLAVGPAAEAIAEQTLALGREWLGLPPPAVSVILPAQALAGPSEEATRAELTAACDRLADAGLAAQFQQAGWRLDEGEIAVWLMVEVDAAPGDRGRSNGGEVCLRRLAEPTPEPARLEIARPVFSGASQSGGEPTQVGFATVAAVSNRQAPASTITLAASLVELAWRRLRTHVTLHALLLAEPAAEDAAASWATCLAPAGVAPVGLAGPVNADRLRWDAPTWQRQTALGLALLLWSDAALATGPTEAARGTGAPAPAWGIGAVAWPTPLREIKQQLLSRCMRLAVARLLHTAVATTEAPEINSANRDACPEDRPGRARRFASAWHVEVDLPPWELPDLAVAPERHRLSLSAAVPLAPPGQVWGGRRPDWRALATLTDELRAAAEARATRAHDEQFGPRATWVEQQVAAWTTAVAGLAAERLERADGWPELRRLAAELQTLTTRLRSASVLIEDWLEATGERFSQAEVGTVRAGRELEELCRHFPPADRAGLLATVMRPWCWPGLAWAYLALLPRSAQKYLDACSRREEARGAEANVHALRQAYLAMAQIVGARQREVDAGIAGLAAAEEEWAREYASLAEPPAPWDARRLDALAQRLVEETPGPARPPRTQSKDGGAVVQRPHPSTTQPQTDCSAQDALPTFGIPGAPSLSGGEDWLHGWGAGLLAPLDGWTAADWLTQALDEDALVGWLDDFVGQAAPLWPVTTPEAETTTWLLWPARRGPAAAAASPTEARLAAALRVAGGRGKAMAGRLHWGCCEGDVLAILRMVKVGLEKEP